MSGLSNHPQAASAVRSLINGGYGEQIAREIIAAVRGEAREWTRSEVLSEVADLLMRADETAAALLVDRLREAGESRG